MDLPLLLFKIWTLHVHDLPLFLYVKHGKGISAKNCFVQNVSWGLSKTVLELLNLYKHQLTILNKTVFSQDSL